MKKQLCPDLDRICNHTLNSKTYTLFLKNDAEQAVDMELEQ
jgi:hypothetical protein